MAEDKDLYFQECWKKGKAYLLTAARVPKPTVKKYGFKEEYTKDGTQYFFIEMPRTEDALARFQSALEADEFIITIAPYVDANEFGWPLKKDFILGMAPLPLAEKMANKMIKAHHPHLLGATIGYFKLDKMAPTLKNGQKKLAFARRMSGTMQYFANLDFAICFYGDAWDIMDRDQRRAVVDHELCHCKIMDGEWLIIGHDFEDFDAIIERHGKVLENVANQIDEAEAKAKED